MKKIIISLILLTLALLPEAYADTIRAAGIVYCPYTCDLKEDGQEGFMTDIAKAVFKNAGHTYTVDMMSFARALKFVVQGTYDALAICNKADVPEGGLIFPDIAIGLVSNTFVVRKDETWTYNGVESLKQIKIGAIIGYTWKDEELNNYMLVTEPPAVQRVGGEDATQKNLQKLLNKRIDAYLDDPNMVKRVASKMGIADQIKFIADVSPTPHYIGFTPGKESSQKYAQILTEGMKKLRESGELKEILSKYGMTDWEK
jgi:polar amino acid transport system substrate-binding protein